MKLIILISILLVLFACTKKVAESSISVEQLRSLLRENSNTALIDVRTTGEFHGPLYHIDGAKSIPLSKISTSIVSLESGEEEVYYMICKSGTRSAKATKIMKNSGLNAINVSGGMMAWSRLKK